MPQYVLLCLNNDEYDELCQHIPEKNSAEYEYCQAFEMKRFAKVKVEVCVCVCVCVLVCRVEIGPFN